MNPPPSILPLYPSLPPFLPSPRADGVSGGHLSRTEFDVLACAYRTAATAATSAGIELHSHLTSDLGAELPLHLSLSRPNVLATAQREGFVELLEERVEKARITPYRPFLPPSLPPRPRSDAAIGST